MALCISVHGLEQVSCVIYGDVQLMEGAGPPEMSLDLSKLPHFMVDSIGNVCCLAEVRNWGELLTVPWIVLGGPYAVPCMVQGTN